ncbi:LytTR family DNA-binding domain-containing protein [Lachnospiraceae bacterium JLR.KK008]
MINIAICDDEQQMSDHIRRMALDFFQSKNRQAVVCQFSCGEELLKYDGKIDILFLDIQMKGINGMETARRLRQHNFHGFLIFITVLKEMVFRSFEVQAYDYLVKPLREKQFVKTMERLFCSFGDDCDKSLLIRKRNETILLPFQEIIFCEVIDRKIYVHTVSAEVFDYYERIDRLEVVVDDRFFRCHRSYLINLQYLKSYKNGMAYMEGGREIPVSRQRGREFSGVILRYMKKWR